MVGHEKQSHIMDAKTGKGSKKFSSVTVIAPKAIDADALATSVSVLGKEKGLEFIESLKDTEAVLISPTPDYEITFSSGAERYID
jgi:thiamine biosynthesis lipoprotein